MYYTYAYLREDKTPYYIGKGKGNRVNETRGRPCNKPPKDRILILKDNLTEEEAFKHEIYMISIFGRKDIKTGILHNKTDGGDGASGAIISQETKEKLRLSNIGKKRSDETRKNISIAKTGIKDSEETKLKKRLSHLGKKQSQEEIEKRRRTRCKKLYMITTPENVIEYTISISDYCNKNNLHTSHMYAVANGKKNHFKGYRIMEIDRNEDTTF
jgi:hypothetical protein